jgi:hypothetical protein
MSQAQKYFATDPRARLLAWPAMAVEFWAGMDRQSRILTFAIAISVFLHAVL